MRTVYILLCILGAVAAQGQSLPALIPYNDNNKWGYADTNGRVVIPAQWDGAFFFKGDKAMVSYAEKYSKYSYCLIDRKGNYIIPPSRKWTWEYGSDGGWKGPLNTKDSSGKWGLIDTNNNLLIPYEWDAPSYGLGDSLKVIYKNGLAGVIDRTNKLVLPCRYAEVQIPDALYHNVHAFLVSDPDNRSGFNRWGVAGYGGQTILPMEYSGISFETHKNSIGFRVNIASENETHSYFSNQRVYTKWLKYPSLKEGPLPSNNDPVPVKESVVGNYIIKSTGNSYSIYNKKGKELMPWGRVVAINGDTIVQRMVETHGDSFVVTTCMLSLKDLKPIVKPVVNITYQRPYVSMLNRGYVCGNGMRALSEARSRQAARPKIGVEGNEVQDFFKDSFKFETHKYLRGSEWDLYNRKKWKLNSEPNIYEIIGTVRPSDGNWKPYWAAVDDSLNYVVVPQPYGEIESYNDEDKIAAIHQSYGPDILISSEGKQITSFKSMKVSMGLLWKGKLYVCATKPGGREKVTDTNGTAHGLWETLSVKGGLVKQGMLGKGQKGVWAADSTGRLYALDPDGVLLLPEFSGKYKRITPIINNLLLVTDSPGHDRLVDGHGVDVLPGEEIQSIEATATLTSPSDWNHYPDKQRLFTVSAHDKNNIYRSVYVDDRCRVYAPK